MGTVSSATGRNMKRTPTCSIGGTLAPALLVVLCLVGTLAQAAGVALMHGFADMSSITLWAQTDGPARLEVEFHPESDPGTVRRVAAETGAAHDYVAHLRLVDLTPGTVYVYRVLRDGQAVPLPPGRFRTQPLWQFRGDPPEFSVAFGSCANLKDAYERPGSTWGSDYRIYDAIAARSPDLMLWLGDNVYFREPEWTSLEGMSARYRAYRAEPALEKLLRATSHVAIWDDHDFGPDDADGSFVGKANALAAFRRYWPNPTFGLPGTPGVFTQVTYGDADFFLLDDRFYRYPNRYPPTAEKAMFGAAQLDWLERALVASKARFKIIASGGQFWNARNTHFEALQNFPTEHRALMDWITARRIRGVVFLSGDRHFGSLLRVPRDGTYPFYEFTSSPLTAGVYEKLSAAERANPDLVPGTLVEEHNFGMLRFAGPQRARVLTLESYDWNGKLLWHHALRAAELR
jgi:alkaline phosphatase D